MTYLSAAGLVLLVAFVSVVMTGVGYILWKRINPINTSNPSLVIGASFFLGSSSFITLWVLLQTILGARAALVLSLAICITLVAPILLHEIRWRQHKRFLITLFVGCSLFALLNFVQALTPLPRVVLNPETAPYAYGFGAVNHSFRAENISNVIVETDALPYINQNSGQALLAAIPHLSGIDMPQFSLIVWHTVVLACAAILVWGVCRIWFDPRRAIFPATLVLLGNTALSYRYVSVTDSSHAILVARNYEVVLGLAGLLIASLVLWFAVRDGFSWIKALVLGTLVFSWSVISGHLSLILLCLGALFFILQGVGWQRWKNLYTNSLVIVLAIISSTLLVGGIFAFHAPDSTIPGVKSVADQPDKPAIELRWFRTVEAELYAPMKMVYLWKIFNNEQLTTERGDVSDVSNQAVESVVYDPALTMDSVSEPTLYTNLLVFIKSLKENEILWKVIRLVRSIQLVLLPLGGFALGYWLLKKRPAILPKYFKEVYITALPLFLVGWMISSVIFMYGQYGELSRFFAPGIAISMFILGALLAVLSAEKNRLIQYTAKGVFIIAVIPVILDFMIIGIVGNFVLPSVDFMRYDSLGVGVPVGPDEVLNMKERFEVLFTESTTRSGS